MSKKRLFLTVSLVFVVLLSSLGLFVFQKVKTTKAMMRKMFQLNSQRRADGYYMAQFEFQMVGVLYYLDKGHYKKAMSRFEDIYFQLKTGEGLIKVPTFANKEEELEFYLNMQNPKTGAFMDDTYPLCTYFQPTLNVIGHMENLAKSIGRPLTLLYPLTFMQQLDSPQELRAYLDDLATVGRLVSKMPVTPYVVSPLKSYDDLENLNLYSFSPEWKRELVKYYWENQDPETGYWGVRLRSNGKLLEGGDLTSTPKFIRLIVDKQGRDRYPEFPLRYKDAMLKTTLKKLKKSMPESLSEQHEWSIDRSRGLRLLIDYLWDSLSAEQKSMARKEMEHIVRTMYSEFYVPEDGAFSLYAGQNQADLDGTAEYVSILKRVGAFSIEQQTKLWGISENTVANLGIIETSTLTEKDFLPLKSIQGINSIRLYNTEPEGDRYFSDVIAVIYPGDTPVLDVAELAPNIDKWINTTPQNMGNWVSKESLKEKLDMVIAPPVLVSKGVFPLEFANKTLRENKKLVAIGFDVLQVPRFKIVYKFVEKVD